MIDFRHQTFLTLCELKSFTETAKRLNITQPAVSQHIKHLEESYKGKLFTYIDRKLTLTRKGKLLFRYTGRVYADTQAIKEWVIFESEGIRAINFGATLTIGEFILPNALARLKIENAEMQYNFLVENTNALLSKLDNGELSFAIIEGHFDKSKYEYKELGEYEFIGVCPPNSPFATGYYNLEDLLNERLILREKGSGTRDVFERLLHENNLSIKSFADISEIGNLGAIKKLVEHELGITFLYSIAVINEIEQGLLVRINLGNKVNRKFHFVYRKDSILKDEIEKWIEILK